MKFPRMPIAALIAFGALSAATAHASTSHSSRQIQQVQIDARPCLFFNLVGVAEADPAFPSQTWFAIPTSDPNYQTFASLLLTAKATDRPINVIADSTNSCGFATARSLSF